jgi:HD-like signal output (HDOD) protein
VDELVARSGILQRTHVITRLNERFGQVDCAQEDLIREIACDRDLVAKLLVVANSAWFGSRTRITRVEEAFSRLGLTEFYHAVVVSVLRLALGETGPVPQAYWGHVELVGHIGELAAQHLAPGLEPQAFLLGVLHDVAVPVMAKHVTDYSYLAMDALSSDRTSPDTEIECYGFNHAQVSMAMARQWGFSPGICAAIPYHHQATLANAPAESRRLLGLLLLASRINCYCAGNISVPFTTHDDALLLAELSRVLGCDETAVKSTVAEIVRLHRLREKAA